MSKPTLSVPLTEQLSRLSVTGVVINEDVNDADLFMFHSKAELEREPFRHLIETLGHGVEREPFTPISDRLWMCDYERVEDHGAYVEVVERLERMTGNALRLTDIVDHVDIEAEEAWVEFRFNGQKVRWDLKVEDDWLDPEVLLNYDELLAKAGSQLRLYSNHTDFGQSALIGAFCADEKRVFDELSAIRMPLLATQR